MLMQIVSFQKLLLMNYYQLGLNKSDVDKRKGSGYKANYAVYCMFTGSFCAAIFTFDMMSWIALPFVLTQSVIYAYFIKNTRLFEIIPVNKKFVMSNIMFIYSNFYVLLYLIAGAFVFIIDIIVLIVRRNAIMFIQFYANISIPAIRPVIFALFAGQCFFGMYLAVWFIRNSVSKVILAAAMTAVTVAIAAVSHFIVPNFLHSNDFTSWVNKLTTGSYCVSLLIMCAIFALFYALCVRLYANRG